MTDLIDSRRRLQLWRISEATNYVWSPDEIADRWSVRAIREWSDYQKLRERELESD